MNHRELGSKRSREDGEGSSSYNISPKDKQRIKLAEAVLSGKFDKFENLDVRNPQWDKQLNNLLKEYETQMTSKGVSKDARKFKRGEEERHFKQMRQNKLAAMESAGQGGWEDCNNPGGRDSDGEGSSSPISAQDQQRIRQAESSIDEHPNSVNNLDVDDPQWQDKVNRYLTDYRIAMESYRVSESAIEKAINKESGEFNYKRDNIYAHSSSEEDASDEE